MKKKIIQQNTVANLVDFGSIVNSYRVARHIQDGTNMNGAIHAETLRTLASDILDFVPSDVTFADWNVFIDKTGGWGNYIISLRKMISGEHKLTGSNSDTHGEITVGGETTGIQVYGYEGNSSLSKTNKEQGKMEGRNIMSELHDAHTIKYFEKLDELFYKGIFDSDYKRTNSAKKWKDMSDNEKLQTIYNGLKSQRAGKNRRFWADTVAVDDDIYQDVTTTDYSLYKGGTLAQKIQETFDVKFVSSWRVKKYGSGTDFTGIGFFATGKNSMRNRIPKRLMFSPNTKNGWSERFEVLYRIAGVDILDLGGGSIIDKL